MKITYISHATLLIEVDGIKIVTDPWVKGASYCDQWYLFPKPLSPQLIEDADVVLYSHGHEDHLNGESLLTIKKDAQIFYPYSWYGGTTGFFKEMGFKNVREIINEKTHKLTDNISVTYLSNNLDNVIVLETPDTVIVNINDALPSASPSMIAYMLHKIRKRWRKIDYVFSSYGGASYFPNTVHFADKNDVEIAEARELFFVTNFCRIVSELNPRYAVPFATDFVLLDANQRWVNEIKFPRDKIRDFYERFTKGESGVEVLEAYPDDFFKDKVFYKTSSYHQKKSVRPLIETIDEDYKAELEQKRLVKKLSVNELESVIERIKKHITAKKYIIPGDIRKKIKFAVKITDGEAQNVLTVDFHNEVSVYSVADIPGDGIDLMIELKSKTVLYAIDNEWGGDAIIIGYGAEIYIYNEDAIRFEYENYCVRLLSRYPNTKEYLKKTPFRALKYLLSDDTKRRNLLNRAIGKGDKVIDYTDALLSKRDLWLTKSKCDVCKACNI